MHEREVISSVYEMCARHYNLYKKPSLLKWEKLSCNDDYHNLLCEVALCIENRYENNSAILAVDNQMNVGVEIHLFSFLFLLV